MKYVELRTRPTAESARPVFSVGSERAGLVSDSLRDGLLAKSGLGLRAGAAGHKENQLRAVDKSSPSYGPNPTTITVGEPIMNGPEKARGGL